MDYDRHIQLSFELIELYSDVEKALLQSIGRRFAKQAEAMTKGDVMDWQIRQLLEIGELRKEHIDIMRKSARVSREKMVELLVEAGYTAANQYEGLFQEAYHQGLVKLLPPATDNSMRLLRVLQTYIDQAEDKLNLVNTSMLRAGQDTFLEVVNSVVAYVSTGIKTPQVAIRDALVGAGRKGLTVFVDKVGRQWSTETYLNMITRTMSSNISNAMEDARRKEYGVDYVEVSSHSGARPRCAPYQGRIYYDGAGHDPLEKYPHLSDTSYGEAAGLFGVNCGHHKYPYVPGLSTQTFFPYDKAENDKVYAQSQAQRKLEREVRQIKRERAILMVAKDREGVSLANQRLEHKWQELRAFTAQTGRTRRYDREKPLNTVLSDEKKKAIVSKNLAIRADYQAVKSLLGDRAPATLEKYYEMKVGSPNDLANRLNTLENTLKNGKIILISETITGRKPPGKQGPSNSVVQHNADNGDVLARVYYNDIGLKVKEVHFTDHKRPDKHAYGDRGEHAHDYFYDEKGNQVLRTTRELANTEREENLDILWLY